MGTSLIDRRFVRPRRPTRGLSCAPGLALLAAFGGVGCQPMDAALDGSRVDPRVIYRHPRPTCEPLTRPEFHPPNVADVVGTPRWVRSWSSLADENPDYPFSARGVTQLAALTGRGSSVWRDGDRNLVALDFTEGAPLVADAVIGQGSVLWLSDGYVYEYAGARCAGFRVCEDGGFCTGGGAKQVGVEGDIFAGDEPYTAPAWSPVTREVVARAGNDLLYAGCTDGQAHWMLQLPPVRAVNAGLYVRESGEIVFVADTSYVFSPDGEVLRQNTIDALSLGLYNTSAATFVEGCGALLVGNDRWAWLDAETLTLGPPIVIPGGYPAFSSFTATQDCGVAAVVNPVVPTLMRFSRDGDVLWGVPTGTARAPVALDDGGFLVIAVDGYQIVDADGNVRETVFHQAPIASCSFEATLAPDGTLFRVCAGDSPDNPYVAAIPTGVRPWGLYGPGEGIDFAHTNAPPAR